MLFLLATQCGVAGAVPGQLTFFDAPKELRGEFGAGVREATLDELDALGVDVVRHLVYWREVAPSPDAVKFPSDFDPRDHDSYGPGGVNWATTDAIVRGAARRGMSVSLVLSGMPPTGRVPRWASRDPNGSESEPDPGEFSNFAYAVGRRYGGQPGSVGYARFISLWNEPNLSLFLQSRGGPGAIAPLYRDLILYGRAGLSASGWNGDMLIGETGPSPPGRHLDPLPFLRHTLCLTRGYRMRRNCLPIDAAGWAHHPYSFVRAPFERPLNKGQISFFNLGDLGRGVRLASRAGAISGSWLFVTEFGYPSRPEAFFGTSRAKQAEFASIAEYLAYTSRGIASFSQYLLRDELRSGGTPGSFASGLCPHGVSSDALYTGGTGCKPAYAAFRTPLMVRAKPGRCVFRTKKKGVCKERAKPRMVRMWGLVRPAAGPVKVRILVQDGRGKPRTLRTLYTDHLGSFSIRVENRKGRRWGVEWNGFRGPMVRAYRF